MKQQRNRKLVATILIRLIMKYTEPIDVRARLLAASANGAKENVQ